MQTLMGTMLTLMATLQFPGYMKQGVVITEVPTTLWTAHTKPEQHSVVQYSTVITEIQCLHLQVYNSIGIGVLRPNGEYTSMAPPSTHGFRTSYDHFADSPTITHESRSVIHGLSIRWPQQSSRINGLSPWVSPTALVGSVCVLT